jgi:hypothetical protein
MIILYIYSICWHMKSTFYEHKHQGTLHPHHLLNNIDKINMVNYGWYSPSDGINIEIHAINKDKINMVNYRKHHKPNLHSI